MPTLNLGTDEFEGAPKSANAIPYWKQQGPAVAQPLPPPAQAAVLLKAAGEAVFAPQSVVNGLTAAAIVTANDSSAIVANTTSQAEREKTGMEESHNENKNVDTITTKTIGTDSSMFSEGASPDAEDDFLRRDGPNLNLATVAGHMIKLQKLLKNDGKPIAVDCFEAITEVSDALDQVFYWGIAESRFPDHPFSALLECEVIETLTPILKHDRPVLVTAALKALGPVLEHKKSCRHFAKREGSFEAIFTALTKFPAKEELISDAIQLCRSAAPGNVEEFLASDCLSGVIASMRRHADNLEIQKRGARLFTELIGMQREDPMSVPISILFVHIGQIVDFVLRAAAQQATSSQVSDAVAHFFEVATGRPENIKKLMRNHALLPFLEMTASKPTAIRNPKAIVSALAAIGNIIPALTFRGKLHMATTIRDIMIKTKDETILTTCFALQHALLVTTKHPPPPYPDAPPSDDDDGFEGDRSNKKASELQLTRPSKQAKTSAEGSQAVPTPEQEYAMLKEHMGEEQIPQCIMIALDHFGEEGDALHEVGRAAIREMSQQRFHWQ